jgi:transmembrane sensor
MSLEEFDELLQRYLRGECTPDEERLVEKWYATWGKGAANALEPARKASVENRLWRSLEEGKDPYKSSQRQMTPWKIVRIAAAILVIAVSLFVVFNRFQAFDADHLLAGSGDQKEIQNTGQTPLKVTLEDGSVVSLEPGSALSYFPASFTGKRELLLTGEAFFEVVKDKKHPFLVFTAGITTKVLGTSFRIKAYQQAKEITVSVSTGRVAVFKQSAQKENNPNERAEVILTPNQQFVYHKTDDKTEKKLVEDPRIVLPEPSLKTHYTNVAVTKIFETLEENYGVVLEYDEEVLAHCTITTTLAGEGLYEKIDIICQAIGAQYTVNGTSIAIKASGCD